MKKTIGTLFLAFFVTVLMTGCGSTGTGDAKTSEYTQIHKRTSLQKLHKLIAKTAEADGWRVTEFKSNTLIAEKMQDENTLAVTISFSPEYFYLSPENSDLQNLLEDAINN